MNKINLELKHYCKDFKKVRLVLKEIGAKKEVVKNQKDYFFNLSDINKEKLPRLKLRIEGKKQLLVYYERPQFVKGKDTASDVKLYEVKDNQLLSFLVKSLGVKAVVDKKREVWRKTNTVFHIDNVKGVGGIFEIELQKKGSKITEADKKIFKSYQDKLLPFLGPVIKGSNVDLVKPEKRISL
ncbi:MAG: CYTH domain-containing protein [Candidatus Paceibacterota bacterium]|jgi:predicted adenylyl cyclase CyaB